MKFNHAHWTKKEWRDFYDYLASLAEDGYREFALRGTPTNRPFLGVRVPKTRALAKEILKGNYAEFLEFEPVSFEEVNIRGFVIAGLPYEEMLEYFNGQVALIENWGNCDAFCASLKSVRKHRDEFLNYLDPLLSGGEFEARVALVTLLAQYMDADYLPVVLDRASMVKDRDEYYVKMALAWLLAECFANFPEPTEAYLKTAHLPKWTHNKTISKICDSYRVSAEAKDRLRAMRRK